MHDHHHHQSDSPLEPADTDEINTLAEVFEHRTRFLSFLERRVGNAEDAEELLQQAMVRAWERADTVVDETRVVAWFYQILRNTLIDFWRSRGAESRAVEAYATELGDPHTPAPEIEAELCKCFEPLVPTLNPGYGEILRRVDLGGERPVDVAADLGISANNAMVRLHRARASLRERLVQTCQRCATHGCLDCSCGTDKD